MTIKNNFAKNLHRIRTAQKLSLYDLEERTGIGANRISNYEHGIHEPKVSILLKLAKGLGVEPWQLLK